MQFLSVYLHIPFCRYRCSYCAFNIYTDRFHLVEHYIGALCEEIRWMGQGEAVHTIYLGGGTPSLLSIPHLERILLRLDTCFDIQHNCEMTLEINPGTVDAAYLAALRNCGVNRISIGMQSALEHELRLFERDHSLQETLSCMKMAHQAGFDNITMDLIYGVPGQTLSDWETSLDVALGMQPDHFSLYALQLESGTYLTRRVKHGEIPAPDDDLAADMYELAGEKLEKAGFEQYEISSWSKPGYTSRHNLQYWHNQSYLGIGAGAHGYAGGFRTVNTMRPERYIERLEAQKTPLPYPRTGATQSFEEVSRSQEIFETIMLGLRLLKEGFSRQDFENRFGVSLESLYGNEIQRLKSQNLLRESDEKLYLTREARLISNRVFEAFVPEIIS